MGAVVQNGYAGKFLQVDLTSGVRFAEKHCMKDFGHSIRHFLLYSVAPKTVCDAFNPITGFRFIFKDFLNCRTHDWMLKCGINNLPGITGANDVLPKKKWIRGQVQCRI
jgi:hypothetical protein